MGNYGVDFQRTASTTNSVGSLNCSATLRRARIYDLMFGSEGTVGDAPFSWQLQRCTAVGTRTAVTPAPLDFADVACVTAAGENHTSTEPTLVASSMVLNIPLNQRATFRWVASPSGELVIPATSASGFFLSTPVAAAVLVTSTMHFSE